jgi:prophage regulatory protein
MYELPETGFLRLPQIIGQEAVTEEQAAENRRNGRNPKRPRSAIPALIPVKKSAWWDGVNKGRFPKPTKTLGKRITAWSVASIRHLIHQAEVGGTDAHQRSHQPSRTITTTNT